MIYLRNKFHTPSFNGSLVIVIKPKAVKKKPARSPFCYRFNKNSILFPVPITTHHFRTYQYVALVSFRLKHVCLRHVVITDCRKLKLQHYRVFQRHNLHSKFRENRLHVSEVEMGQTLAHARTRTHTNQHKHTQHTQYGSSSLLSSFMGRKIDR